MGITEAGDRSKDINPQTRNGQFLFLALLCSAVNAFHVSVCADLVLTDGHDLHRVPFLAIS